MLDSIKKLNDSANQGRKAEDEAVAEVKDACRPDIDAARSELPRVERLCSEAQELRAQVISIDWNRCSVRLSRNGQQAEHELGQLLSSPANVKDGIRMWQNVDYGQIRGSLSLVDSNRVDDLIDRIRTLLRPARNGDAIERNIKILREALQEAANRIEEAAKSDPVVVMVPGKRPASKPTKVESSHKIFS
jgi:hypothetical protein